MAACAKFSRHQHCRVRSQRFLFPAVGCFSDGRGSRCSRLHRALIGAGFSLGRTRCTVLARAGSSTPGAPPRQCALDRTSGGNSASGPCLIAMQLRPGSSQWTQPMAGPYGVQHMEFSISMLCCVVHRFVGSRLDSQPDVQ